MNIAIVQPAKSLKLRPETSMTMGGNEELYVVIRELLRRGHRVTFHGTIGAADARRGGIPAELRGLRDAGYGPIARDEDAVFVNNGVWPNIPHQFNADGSLRGVAVTYVARALQVLRDYRGYILYHQSDVEQFFNALQNVRRFLEPPSRKFLTEHGLVFGDEWDGIHTVVLLKTKDAATLGPKLKRAYDHYDDPSRTTFEYWNCSSFIVEFTPASELVDVEYPLVYVGHDRPRKRLKLYYNRPDAHIFGGWRDAAREWMFPQAQYHGKVKVPEVGPILSRSGCHVVVTDDSVRGCGWLPARIWEAVQAGCPVLLDEAMVSDHDSFQMPASWIVNPEGLDEQLPAMVKNRKAVVSLQHDVLADHPLSDVKYVMDELMSLLCEYPAWEK